MDEVHLFVHYALSFRKEFALLSKVLFKHLKTDDNYCARVLIIFMTATCTVEIFEQVQSLTGIPFYQDKRNVFWPSPTGMANRSISIEVIYSSQTMKQFIEFVTPGIKNSRTKCYIGYSNFRSTIEKANVKVASWLDDTGY